MGPDIFLLDCAKGCRTKHIFACLENYVDRRNKRFFFVPMTEKIFADSCMITDDHATSCSTVWPTLRLFFLWIYNFFFSNVWLGFRNIVQGNFYYAMYWISKHLNFRIFLGEKMERETYKSPLLNKTLPFFHELKYLFYSFLLAFYYDCWTKNCHKKLTPYNPTSRVPWWCTHGGYWLLDKPHLLMNNS